MDRSITNIGIFKISHIDEREWDYRGDTYIYFENVLTKIDEEGNFSSFHIETYAPGGVQTSNYDVKGGRVKSLKYTNKKDPKDTFSLTPKEFVERDRPTEIERMVTIQDKTIQNISEVSL